MSKNNIFKNSDGEKNHHKNVTLIERKINRNIPAFQDFINSQIFSSILLVTFSIVSIVMASTEDFLHFYHHIKSMKIGFLLGEYEFLHSLQFFANDFLMTFFFFFLGMEIKKEFFAGELSQSKVRNTVLLCSLGGVLVPSAIYLMITYGTPEMSFWGVPTATDTAFALGFLALFRKKVPSNLFAFVAAFAVIDDLSAILILSLFYSPPLEMVYIYYSITLMALIITMNLFGVRHYLSYLMAGCFLWYFIEHAGLHGTLAGVLTALCIPTRPQSGPRHFVQNLNHLSHELKNTEEKTSSSMVEDEKKHGIVEKIESLAIESSVPLIRMQHGLEPLVFLVILPFFAFINAGIPLSYSLFQDALQNLAAIGVFFALIFGKSIGISLFTFFTLTFKLGSLPKGVNFQHIVGISFIAGIGFTMSIFIGETAVPSPKDLLSIKIGIFSGSLVSALIGALYLFLYNKRRG